jgi:hypothetical protein
MMEYWNDGIMELWNYEEDWMIGLRTRNWNDGIMIMIE